MITIKDMAYKAGVSPTTISNVLHGRTEKLSQETLKRVQNVIEESNYVSNMGARLLANNGSRILGVILTYSRRNEKNAIQDPFYSEIVGALEQEIRQNGYYMMLYTSGNIEESLKLAKAWNIEGLIILSASAEDCNKFKRNTDIPIAFIDSYVEDSDFQYANVGLQDRVGAYQMTKYLIDNGHRNIAFFADANPPISVDKERYEGYQQALTENNIHNSSYFHINYKLQERHEFLSYFADHLLKNFTALFFASDFYAADAIRCFQSKNIKVPEDISVVGFDDNVYSQLCHPLLTTVHQNVSDKAKYAIRLLMDIINHEKIQDYFIQLPISLTVRDSVKNIKS